MELRIIIIILLVILIVYYFSQSKTEKFYNCPYGVSESGACLPCDTGYALVYSGYGLVCQDVKTGKMVYPGIPLASYQNLPTPPPTSEQKDKKQGFASDCQKCKAGSIGGTATRGAYTGQYVCIAGDGTVSAPYC